MQMMNPDDPSLYRHPNLAWLSNIDFARSMFCAKKRHREQKQDTERPVAKFDDLDYGSVMITAGRYKGTIGYYDDTVGRMAYVYLGAPFISPAVWICWECI